MGLGCSLCASWVGSAKVRLLPTRNLVAEAVVPLEAIYLSSAGDESVDRREDCLNFAPSAKAQCVQQ